MTVSCSSSELIAGRFPKIPDGVDVEELSRRKAKSSVSSRGKSREETLEDVLVAGWKNLNQKINVSDFGITSSDFSVVYFSILNRHEELFYIATDVSWSEESRTKIVYEVFPVYLVTDKATITSMNAEISVVVEKAKACIEEGMSQVDKALVIHDFLCQSSVYDSDFSHVNNRNIYGPLVEGVSVCAGYTAAYRYLLRQPGIDIVSEYVPSDAMNHAWNLVEIDGEKYHVDVTYDDPADCSYSRVNHSCFMLDDEAIKYEHLTNPAVTDPSWDDMENQHATDSKYNDYFWRSAETCVTGALPWVRGKVYCFDDNGALRAYDTSNGSGSDVLYTVEDLWYVWDKKGYSWGKFPQLCKWQNNLIFSQRETLHIWEVGGGYQLEIQVPEDYSPTEGYIYGLWQDHGEELYLTVNTLPKTEASQAQDTRFSVTLVPLQGASLSLKKLNLRPGEESDALTVQMEPENATNTAYSLTSSNADVVTVTPQGTLLAVGTGEAQVMLKTEEGNFQDVCQISVHDDTYQITVDIIPQKGGTVTGAGEYAYGASVSLQATPAANYEFSGWYDDGVCIETGTKLTFQASKDRTLVANFQLLKFVVTAQCSQKDWPITGTGIYDYGTEVPISISDEGDSKYDFDGWYEGTTKVSQEKSFSTTVTRNVEYTAKVKLHEYNVSLKLSTGWNLLCVPMDLSSQCRASFFAEFQLFRYEVNGAFTALASESELTAGRCVWLYNPSDSTREFTFSGYWPDKIPVPEKNAYGWLLWGQGIWNIQIPTGSRWHWNPNTETYDLLEQEPTAGDVFWLTP